MIDALGMIALIAIPLAVWIFIERGLRERHRDRSTVERDVARARLENRHNREWP